MLIAPGEMLPSFSLQNHEDAAVSDSSLRGAPAVLYWFPRADTPGCTAQAVGLRDQAAAFAQLGVTVVGISGDSVADLKAFSARYRLPFQLLSDPGMQLSGTVGAAAAGAQVADRVALIVDHHGVVERSWVVTDPEFFAEDVLDHVGPLTEGQ